MRLIDADALIEFCAERWIPLNIDAVNMQPTIQPEKAQLSKEGTTSDTISRQAAIDIGRNATVDTNPSHFEAHQKFTQFMDDAEVSSFGRWQWANGFNTALTAVRIDLKKLPTAQPETLTDKEQRIFLAAMGREEKVCRQVDDECGDCRDSDSLVRTCHEITRKVKGTLWT